ncbi:MAG: ATP-grasp domain-containing protein, partial [Firmicutes bacterium]|nr:ATP-grasp domain-containing protein [Bacillota bacterium]
MSEKVDFMPILLASDINVYSMARAFHEEYGIKSLMVARERGAMTKDTNILDYLEVPGLNETEVFLKTMDELYDEYGPKGRGKTLILMGCADHYVRLIVENKEHLKEKGFILPYSDKKVLDELTLKESFYRLCDRFGLDYAKTFIYKPEM